MIFNQKIKVPLSNLYNADTEDSNLETQCLFGEEVIVIEEKGAWSKVKCKLDDYVGWLKKSNLSDNTSTSHIIIDKSIIVYKEPNLKSKKLFDLFCGSKVNLKIYNKEWYEMINSNNEVFYISKNNLIIQKDKIYSNWLKLAYNFLGSPYHLGGKSVLGIDCSGLVQLILMISGILIPRNSNDQSKFECKYLLDTNKVTKGCLIFWKGHVSLSISNDKIIHSNAHHMKVEIESLDEACLRIKKKYGDITKIKKIRF